MKTLRQKITPFLWFDHNAEEAVNFYISLFENSHIRRIVPGPGDVPLVIDFQLAGLEFTAMNTSPAAPFNEAISLSVDCQSQSEVDELWEKIAAEGKPIQCGWIKDRYGLTWQIVPGELLEMINDPDPAKVQRVMQCMQQMIKLEIEPLKQAYAG